MSKVQQLQSGYQSGSSLLPNIKKERNNVSFGNEQAKIPPSEKEDKKGLSFKTITNILGVAAWLAIVGYSTHNLKLLRPNHPDSIIRKSKNIKKQLMSYKEKLASNSKEIDETLKGTSFKKARKFFYRLGEGFQDAKINLGGELFNNLLYAFGTLVVMPAVVIFSPFGKKNSSKEDKTFAVLRQPISVAATLGMQFTFDKMIDKYVPEVIKQNQLEDKSILKDGKILFKDGKGNFIHENYEKIKYNSDAAKEGFKAWNDNKILDEKHINELFTLSSFEEESSGLYKEKLKNILNTKYADKGLKLNEIEDFNMEDSIEAIAKFKENHPKAANNIKKLLNKFKKYAEVLDNNKMAVQKSKTWVNVVAASIIGCTFLNVVYGKTMKSLRGAQWFKNLTQEDKKTPEDKKEVK